MTYQQPMGSCDPGVGSEVFLKPSPLPSDDMRRWLAALT